MNEDDILSKAYPVEAKIRSTLEEFEQEIEEQTEPPKLIERLPVAPEELIGSLAQRYRYWTARRDAVDAATRAIREEISKALKYCDDRLEWYKSRISELVPPGEKSSFVDRVVSVKYTTSTRCEIEDERAIPLDFCDTIVSTARVKEALKAGQEVPGARLVKHYNLQVGAGGDRAKRNAKARLEKKSAKEIENLFHEDDIPF